MNEEQKTKEELPKHKNKIAIVIIAILCAVLISFIIGIVLIEIYIYYEKKDANLMPIKITKDEKNDLGLNNDTTGNINQQTLKDCLSDIDCPNNFICFNSKLCPMGMECNAQTGDLKCHQICKTDSDCDPKTPNCLEVNIFQGDVGGVVNMCFSEECAKYGKEIEENGICCGDLAEGYCVKRNALASGNCAKAGEWYSKQTVWGDGEIDCCEGLKKLHPERDSGYCVVE